MSEPNLERMNLLTLPNSLSLSRIALIPVIAWAILAGAGEVAIGVFCFVVVTDVLDGLIARRSQQVSHIGTLLDHGSDAVFVTAVSTVCAYLGLLPPLLPLLIAIKQVPQFPDRHAQSSVISLSSAKSRSDSAFESHLRVLSERSKVTEISATDACPSSAGFFFAAFLTVALPNASK